MRRQVVFDLRATYAHAMDVPNAWDEEADLVVLGSGGAGLTGALVAAAEGADVLVLEKTELVGGTTAMSGGWMWVPLNDHMAEVGVSDSRDEVLAYLTAISGTAGDPELLQAIADHAAEMLRYLETRCGANFASYPHAAFADYRLWVEGAKPGGRSVDSGAQPLAPLGDWAARLRDVQPYVRNKLRYYEIQGHTLPPEEAIRLLGPPDVADPERWVGGGPALVAQLLRGCLEHGVTIRLETPAQELIVDGGRVVGVRAKRDGWPFFVRARSGVLVATGGFAHNEELKERWLDKPLRYSCEIEANQGDGHLMGEAIGAQLANLSDAWWCPCRIVRIDGDLVETVWTRIDRVVPRQIIVNGAGKRFMNECLNYYDAGVQFGTKEDGPKNLPAWQVFDEEGRRRYSSLATKAPEPLPDWVWRAESLEELAALIGVDAAGLVTTVVEFNRNAREGKDPDFGRGENPYDIAWGDPRNEPNPSLGPVDSPPYYASEFLPGALGTKGGLRINRHGEVLGVDDAPIPGLYASGNSSSCGVPMAYPGPGGSLGPLMTFSYLIGQRIAVAVRGTTPS